MEGKFRKEFHELSRFHLLKSGHHVKTFQAGTMKIYMFVLTFVKFKSQTNTQTNTFEAKVRSCINLMVYSKLILKIGLLDASIP